MKALVIDDHPLYVDAIENVLRMMDPDIEILKAFTAKDGCAWAETHRDFDLVILGWNLPSLGGTPLLDMIRKCNRSAWLVVLAPNGDTELATRAIRGGAAGVIPKSSNRDLVQNALRLVMSGGIYFPADALASGPRKLGGHTERRSFALTEEQRQLAESQGLSKREIEVLELLVSGCSNKVIGHELDIAECTVKAHMTSILRAFKAGSRTQAIYRFTQGCPSS